MQAKAEHGPATWSDVVVQLSGHADRMAKLTDTDSEAIFDLGMARLVRWAEARESESWGEQCPGAVIASAKACQRYGARRLLVMQRRARGEDWLAELWTDADLAECHAYLAELLLSLRPEHSAPLIALASGQEPEGGAAWKRLARAREALAVACLRHGFEHVANGYLRTLPPLTAELVRLTAKLGTRN